MLDCSSSKTCHGIILMAIGGILLLNTLGILKETTGLVISVAAAAMLVYGFLLCDGPQRVLSLLKAAGLLKKNTPPNNNNHK